MVTYTNVFSGDNISPSEVGLASLALTADVTLFWPEEAQPNVPLAADIVEITSSDAANRAITMPDATRASNGTAVLFNNLSAQTVLVKDSAGTQLVSLASGEQWQIYLASNATAAGTWRVYQYGAGASSANAAALAGPGLKAINTTLAQSVPMTSFQFSFTLTDADRATFFNWDGTGAGVTVTLPDAVTVGNDWFVQVRNNGGNTIDIAGAGGNLINGLATLTLQPQDSALIACDGTQFVTIGLGRSASYGYDFVVVDVTGSANYTLSGAELNRIGYEFVGVMGANFSVIVPATIQQYWVFDNTTAGAFTLSIKTAAQVTPLGLTRGDRIIAYCDGNNVVSAMTAPAPTSVNAGTF